jgi:uncharacterized protein (TIGR04551 family)
VVLACALWPAVARADDDDDDDEVDHKTDERANKKPNPSPYADARSDDWFSLSGPAVEIDGYFRVRSELFHNFSLSRLDGTFDPARQLGTPPLWPQPPDNSYTDTTGVRHQVELCGAPDAPEVCQNEVQAGANMRLRLEPSIHISDNLHIWSQIDMLDNVVLGSTPQGYANLPAANGGYGLVGRGYASLGAFATTQWAPQSGVTSVSDTIMVKRAWGSYVSPIGKIAFGRMPHHWGLGMLYNAGDGYDSDWQSTVDRLTFTYSFPDWNLYLNGSWDFANEGVTTATLNTPDGAGTYNQQGEAIDLATKDDLDHWAFTVVHKVEPQLARYRIAKGIPVVNAGLYLAYETQDLAHEAIDGSGASIGSVATDQAPGFVRREYEAVIGDVWIQLLYDKLRFEAEAAWTYGTFENTLRASDSDYDNLTDPSNDGWTIAQFGLSTQTEWRALEDRLRLNFGFGIASGDPDVASLTPSQSASSGSALDRQLTLDRTYSTFRYHPDYRVDLILFRNILSRVQGAYYFRPSIDYDLMRDPDGQRMGGGAALIWSRATEPVQAPGHAPDLGLELNLKLFYQLSDGRMSADVMEMGGLYTAIEYGVLFPLPGLDYLPGQVDNYSAANPGEGALDIDPAQIARWYLGIMF